jgi:hypothetical protein
MIQENIVEYLMTLSNELFTYWILHYKQKSFQFMIVDDNSLDDMIYRKMYENCVLQTMPLPVANIILHLCSENLQLLSINFKNFFLSLCSAMRHHEIDGQDLPTYLQSYIFESVTNDIFYDTLVKINIAALKIQNQWRKCISNPDYVLCRKRLLTEYKTMNLKHKLI